MKPPTTCRAVAVASAVALGVVRNGEARAGMPMATLSDVGRARLQTVSFFLLVLLLCAWGVQKIWNALAADVPRMPKLSYRKAIGVMVLWGLLFVLVLTMISGARELMTPGAWKKQGFTYVLDEPPKPPTRDPTDAPRRAALERLGTALRVYAWTHGGQFPPHDQPHEIDRVAWDVPDTVGLRFLYVPGRKLDDKDAVVAYEPALHGPMRYALYASGQVKLVGPSEVPRAARSEVDR